ncbi:MAG TPA: hypothetical protein VH592_11385 [Gemmataceae bacterium]|jgi:hypothetical protein
MDFRQVEEMEHRGWFSRLHLSWPMLFLAGWLLYEFTAQPGLAALVFCAKFGLMDIQTAFWLRRVDPDPRRGQTCFWAYLTYGLWKVAVIATLVMITIGFLGDILGRIPRQQAVRLGISPVIMGALTAAVVGFGVSLPTACITLWSAWRNGVRVWLGQAPNWARKDRHWPPRQGWINTVPIVGLTIFGQMAGLLLVLSITLLGLVQFGDVWVILLLMATILLAITVSTILLFRLSMRLIALSPEECWMAEEGEEVYEIRAAEEGGFGA